MGYLYSQLTNCFYIKEDLGVYRAFNNLPEDLVAVSCDDFYQYAIAPPPDGKIRGYKDGSLVWVDRGIDNSVVEYTWVSEELTRARGELEKVQDSDSSSTGTVSSWRDYRKQLRVWEDNENFPNKEFRPKAPDAL